MEYRCPTGGREDKESNLIFDLQSFQEAPTSKPCESVRLISRGPYGQSSTPASSFTAKLQGDQLIFPATPDRSTHFDHRTYIVLKLAISTSRPTTPYTNVTVETMAPRTQQQGSSQRYDSHIETGMNVHLVKGARGGTMYITDPTRKSYGTMSDIAKNKSWLNGESVGKGQIPYATGDGSMFFKDDKGEWFGLISEGEDEVDIKEGRSCLPICI